jgi:hypothetical protein
VSPFEAIRALNQRYARAVDERDLVTLAALFHDEAEITGARGRLDKEAWLETMRAPRTFPVSMHLLGDPLIELVDDDHARVDTYGVVHQLSDDGQLTLGIRYLDELVLLDGSWRIRRREARTLFMR